MTYICTWTYETDEQDMTPEEAARLATSVMWSGMDPGASQRGYVLIEVKRDEGGNGPLVSVGDFEVSVTSFEALHA